MTGDSTALSEEEAHLWLVRPDDIRDEKRLEGYQGLLSPDEKRQYDRFHFDRHRHLYLVARALVRTTLSPYLDGPPESWTFERNAHGRPEVAPLHDACGLRFNLSHTSGYAGLVVTRTVDCGFDVENTGRLADPMTLVERFFASREVAGIRAMPAGERVSGFFRHWTLKEAYIKARGMGLALPLDGFWFDVRDESAVRIGFEPKITDDPGIWQFHYERLETTHFLAVALRSAEKPLRITTRVVVP